MELVEPSARYKDSFMQAAKEFAADESNSWRHPKYAEALEHESDFAAFVASMHAQARGENLPDGFVPQTDYWLIDDGDFIGRVSIRHEFTEHLLTVGGLIGYDIRPSKRGRGYGNKILELALPKAKSLGLKRVLITCDVTNEASKKIVENNGGVLENQVPNPETGVDKLRYWIDIK